MLKDKVRKKLNQTLMMLLKMLKEIQVKNKLCCTSEIVVGQLPMPEHLK